MRPDALGFFWQDLPPEPKKKAEEKVKRVAPEPTWLADDYLPGLEEALRFPVEIMTDLDIMVAHQTQDVLLYDTECYPNYWCGIFRSYATGKVLVFEKTDINIGLNDSEKMRWILANFTIVTFNGINYDAPMTALALDGVEVDILKEASDLIIMDGWRPQDILKKHKVAKLGLDHIDLIALCPPPQASLKAYGGRLHVPRMQDLPFHVNTNLSPNQIAIVRWYCVNDTTSTAFLYQCLKEDIDLRYQLSNENRIDLRSKSDAQIAEAIIGAEYEKRTGRRAQRPTIEPGTVYYYKRPANLFFQTPIMREVLDIVCRTPFVVNEFGKIEVPKEIEALKFQVGETIYQMGNGGLHSTEKNVCHVTDSVWQLVDADVASYYPMIILLQRYFPPHLGEVFLEIFGDIVRRRLKAKKDLLKAIAEALKIVINGTYGKLGSVWSIVYGPELLFHVTLGGQLFLLMLAEAAELNGIHVVSGNTDGVMFKCRKTELDKLTEVIKWWEGVTGFETEGKNYKGIYSRDINSYIAIDEKGNCKHKGAYGNPWDEKGMPGKFKLKKNPATTICIKAVDNFLVAGTPVEQTIRDCRDIKQFVKTQGVKGGAVKDGEFLGKQVRWYYSTEERGKEIVKATNGHLVGASRGAKPLMQLPDELPADIDYEWYINKSNTILKEIGVH